MEIEECHDPKDLDNSQVLGIYRFDPKTNEVHHTLMDEGYKPEEGTKIYVMKHKSNPYYIDILNPDVVKAFIEVPKKNIIIPLRKTSAKVCPDFSPMNPQYSRGRIPWSYIIPERFKEPIMGMI